MKRLRNLRLLFVFSGLLAGCKDEVQPCNRYLHGDEEFEITVVESADPKLTERAYLAAGLPSCPLEDVKIGDKFRVALGRSITVETGDECSFFECPISLPTPAARHDEPQSLVGALGYVCASPTAKIQLDESCEIGRVVWLYVNQGRSLYSSGATNNPFILLRGLSSQKSLPCRDLADRFPEAVPNQRLVCADQWIVKLADKKKP